MELASFLLLCLSFIYVLPEGEAIRCYVCNTRNEVACGDPFFPMNIVLVNCDAKAVAYAGRRPTMCKKVSRRLGDGSYETIRDCSGEDASLSDGQMCITQPGGEFRCTCYGDACNSAPSGKSSGTLLFTLLAAGFIMFFLRPFSC